MSHIQNLIHRITGASQPTGTHKPTTTSDEAPYRPLSDYEDITMTKKRTGVKIVAISAVPVAL